MLSKAHVFVILQLLRLSFPTAANTQGVCVLHGSRRHPTPSISVCPMCDPRRHTSQTAPSHPLSQRPTLLPHPAPFPLAHSVSLLSVCRLPPTRLLSDAVFLFLPQPPMRSSRALIHPEPGRIARHNLLSSKLLHHHNRSPVPSHHRCNLCMPSPHSFAT